MTEYVGGESFRDMELSIVLEEALQEDNRGRWMI